MAQNHLIVSVMVITLAQHGIILCDSHSTSGITQGVTEVVTSPSLVQEVEDNSRYKTLEANATLLKLLVDEKTGVSESEVFDMLNSRDDNTQHVDLPPLLSDVGSPRIEATNLSDSPDGQAEFLQVPGELVRKDSKQLRLTSGEPIGMAALVMLAVTCSIIAIAYISIIVWRKIYLSDSEYFSDAPPARKTKKSLECLEEGDISLRKRNGLKHELLKNEEHVAETRIELN